MERTKLATELVNVNFRVYDCNTQIWLNEFNMRIEFPKEWNFTMRWRKLKSYCGYLHRKYSTLEFRFKLPE